MEMEMENDLEALYKQKEDLESELAPFELIKENLYEENQDKVDQRSKIRNSMYKDRPDSIKKIVICFVIASIIGLFIIINYIVPGNTSDRTEIVSGRTEEIVYVAILFAIPLILAVVFIIMRLKKALTRKALQQKLEKLNTELRQYDLEVENIEKDMAKYKNEINAIDQHVANIIRATKREKYARNHIFVYAGAIYNGHLDDNTRREVIIDGYSHGSANPWLIVGLNSDYHTICVNYRDGQYSGNTEVINFRADDCSKIYVCKKENSIYLHTDPLYEIGELDNLLSSVRSDEKSRFPDKSIL